MQSCLYVFSLSCGKVQRVFLISCIFSNFKIILHVMFFVIVSVKDTVISPWTDNPPRQISPYTEPSPPPQRPHWTETVSPRSPPDKGLPGQRHPPDKYPPGQRHPWTETPPGQRRPLTEIPLDRDPQPCTVKSG